MSKHTPGPWFVVEYPDGHNFIRSGDGCEQPFVANVSGKNYQGNTDLIAAAPDLLAALKAVVAIADRRTDEFDAARAAIAKATGEQS